ncbi:MAG: hypothetical protein KF834_07115 [Burkholderiales bacterium]|nr:hypothetical protein [Burkholderiales bacterium]
MSNYLVLHEDVFYEHCKPYRHPKSVWNIWGGYGLETFGSDFELVSAADPNYVWTVLEDGVNDDCWIVTGIHRVNRICHLLTEVPHYSIPIDFRVRHRPRPASLTKIGLARQIYRIKRIERGLNVAN